MKTEKEKMIAGEMYNPADPVLVKERGEARRKVRIYNQTLETEGEKRTQLLRELLGSRGKPSIWSPTYDLTMGITPM